MYLIKRKLLKPITSRSDCCCPQMTAPRIQSMTVELKPKFIGGLTTYKSFSSYTPKYMGYQRNVWLVKVKDRESIICVWSEYKAHTYFKILGRQGGKWDRKINKNEVYWHIHEHTVGIFIVLYGRFKNLFLLLLLLI